MNVLVSQRHHTNQYGQWINVLEGDYVRFFEAFGIRLIAVPNGTRHIEDYLNIPDVHGLILTGGNNVSPKLYGPDNPEVEDVSEQRDKTEAALLDAVIERNWPLLAVCRGMQHINVYFGGKLHADIHPFVKEGVHKPGGTHPVRLHDERLISVLGKDTFIINSYHNQGILKDDLSDKLTAMAMDEAGEVVEGYYSKEYPIAGVQWHPERGNPAKELDTLLVKSFMKRELYWEKK